MRKFSLTLLMLSFFANLHATIGTDRDFPPTGDPLPAPKASEVMIPLFNSGYLISVKDFTDLRVKDYRKLTGQRIKLGQRIRLKLMQRKLEETIQDDGTVDIASLQRHYGFFSRWSWHWGGFALGFLLIIGPIIALFFKDEYKWDRFHTAVTVNGIVCSLLLVYLRFSGF